MRFDLFLKESKMTKTNFDKIRESEYDVSEWRRDTRTLKNLSK